MKNGFTWQGTEIAAWGGSDARTAGYLQYGKVSGPWSVYFTGDGLNDRGWRYESPEHDRPALRRYRLPLAGFRVPPDRDWPRAASTVPPPRPRWTSRTAIRGRSSPTRRPPRTDVGTLQLTGRVDISPTWDLAGNAYFRRFSQTYVDGNDGNFENCSSPVELPRLPLLPG